MKNQKLKVQDFQKLIRSEMEDLAKKNNENLDKEPDRSYYFQKWVANLLFSSDQGFDTEPDEALIYSEKLEVDLVFEDQTNKHMLIAKCNYQGSGKAAKQRQIEEKELKDFFDSHEQFLKKGWVKKNGSEAAFDMLGDYKTKIDNGYSVDYFFITTSKATPVAEEVAEKYTNSFKEKERSITFRILDLSGLKQRHEYASFSEESPPEEVEISLPQEKFFEVLDGPFKTIIAVIKGNLLRSLFQTYKESLFARNIRGYLGSRGLNSGIVKTAENQADKFLYFNNGVSAICTDYEITSNGKLKAYNFQIINGAQTVGALKSAKENPGIQVLFRLTQTEKVKSDKGINSEIIRYNNIQNSIKLSDFRSNDPIQEWLQNKFKDFKKYKVLQPVRYIRKRSEKREMGYILKLEELAKIRYSFLFEPTLIHDSPKNLWTLHDEEGVYEKAFGLPLENGSNLWHCPDSWSEEEFQCCLLAIAIYVRIEDSCREAARKDAKYKFLKRFRYHILALSNIYITKKSEKIDQDKLLINENVFNTFWSSFWKEARRIQVEAYTSEIHKGKTTMYAFVRSKERWEEMKNKFTFNIGLEDDD